jgi:hypothetical protein
MLLLAADSPNPSHFPHHSVCHQGPFLHLAVLCHAPSPTFFAGRTFTSTLGTASCLVLVAAESPSLRSALR